MKFLRKIALILTLVLPALQLFSQDPADSLRLDDNNSINTYIEDAITDIESDDQVDWSDYTDNLQDLLRRPLDLNTATKDELLELPGMTEIVVTNLLDYLDQFGTLTSIFELQAVPGVDYDLFQKIKPFITCSASTSMDMGNKALHPAGPSFKEIMANTRREVWLRAITVLEKQNGFTDPDTNSDGSLTSRYLSKSPVRSYFRYRSKYGKNYSAALVLENDPGEAYRWDPRKLTFGFDFAAGHISIGNYKNLKRAVIGDYTLRVGQGLILSSMLGFNKGGDVIGPVKKQNEGIKPYYSVNENQFFRGAAATVAVKKFYFTGYFAYNLLDARVDTLSLTDIVEFLGDIEAITSLPNDGFHRTESGYRNKNSTHEVLYGGRAEYKSRRLTIGTTHLVQHYGFPRNRKDAPHQVFDFVGDFNYINGIDFDWTVRNFDIFGEIARSRSGGIAATVGILSSLHPKLDIALQGRSFDADFHSTKAFAFAERPRNVQNERGFYAAFRAKPFRKWTFSTYADHFWFPWQRFRVNFPSMGREYLAQLEFKPSRKMTIYARFRSDHKEQNSGELPDGQQLETPVPTQRQSLRINFRQKIGRDISVQTRFEHSWWRKGDEEKSTGFLLFQDISWKLNRSWKLTGRFALFDMGDYNSRIYAYENDLYGTFSILPYSGSSPGYNPGARYYLMAQYGYRFMDIWIKVGQWNYLKQNTVATGLNEIQGNTKTELRVQVRFTF